MHTATVTESADAHIDLQTEEMTMFRTIRTTLTAPLALLLLASAATAQDNGSQSTVQGFSVGVHGAVGVTADKDLPSGNGLSLMVGYGLNQRLSFHAATAGTRIGSTDTRESYYQSFIDLESRFTFGRNSSRWRPHLALGASARTVHEDQPEGEDEDPKVRTTVGTTAGAGLSYFLSPAVALDGSLRYTFADANRSRLMLGVTWYPRAR